MSKLIEDDDLLSRIEYSDKWNNTKCPEWVKGIINSMPKAQLSGEDTTFRWIPCGERLPEDVEYGEEYPTVIFCTKDAVYVGFYEYYLGGRWWTLTEDYTVNNVIAWMPMPKPYKESSDD